MEHLITLKEIINSNGQMSSKHHFENILLLPPHTPQVFLFRSSFIHVFVHRIVQKNTSL